MTGAASALCLIRGGGDLATGVAWRLTRAGMDVVICELAEPLTVRRTVALSSAVHEGVVEIEGMVGRRTDAGKVHQVIQRGEIPVIVAPDLLDLGASIVVDARLAKRNIDTQLTDGSLVVGLGPGFTVSVDCHAIVETQRGPSLGRVLWQGSAAPNTGTPGTVAGRSGERVLRAPTAGPATWDVAIGDHVEADQLLGELSGLAIRSPFDGVVRGLIRAGVAVPAGLKIGDIDPRPDTNCNQISDKALAVGGGVVEAALGWLHRRSPLGQTNNAT